MIISIERVITALALYGLASASIIDHENPLIIQSSVSEIPLLGFGTWNVKGNTSDIVSAAIQTGFRHIDCAKIYGNQEDVGKGLTDGLKKTGLSREDLWITSKLWNDRHAPHEVPGALQQTLDELDLEYLDLYLMHWPVGSKDGKNSIDFVDTWKAMAALVATGKVRHVGVSNFSPSQLRELLDSPAGRISRPYAHQLETHPYLPQSDFIDWHQTYGIHVTAYSPLGNSNPTYKPGENDVIPLLKNPVVNEIAKERGCSAAQVALKWGLIRRTSVIPKSGLVERMEEDFKATECELHAKDLARLRKELPVKRFNNPAKNWGVTLFDGLEGITVLETIAQKGSQLYNQAAAHLQDL